MQINGIGSGHSTNMHQVTECSHEHSVSKKKGGAASASSGNNALQAEVHHYKQQEGQFSLVSWLKNALSGGGKILQKIWGESSETAQTADSSAENISQTEEQVMATAVIRQQPLQGNPYFSAIEDTGRAKQTVWEKVRVRFQSIAGQLTRHFSGRNGFQTKQEKPKEDLRRHSRYRQDDLEIDCILTDDSYLLDSYDRKGEYSKLSAKK